MNLVSVGHFAKEHPIETAVGGITIVLILYWLFFGGSSSDSSNQGGLSSAFFAAQAAQAQSGNALAASQSHDAAAVAAAGLQYGAQVSINSAWSSAQTVQALAATDASVAINHQNTQAAYDINQSNVNSSVNLATIGAGRDVSLAGINATAAYDINQSNNNNAALLSTIAADTAKASYGRDISLASIGADVTKTGYGRDISLADIGAGRDAALAGITASRDVNLASIGADVTKTGYMTDANTKVSLADILAATNRDNNAYSLGIAADANATAFATHQSDNALLEFIHQLEHDLGVEQSHDALTAAIANDNAQVQVSGDAVNNAFFQTVGSIANAAPVVTTSSSGSSGLFGLFGSSKQTTSVAPNPNASIAANILAQYANAR